MLDADLARLYGVTTSNLNKAVTRNRERFPSDFMFQIPAAEVAQLFSPGHASPGHGGRRKPARVFTEQGVAMLSTVLGSPRAIKVNIGIMRAFVRLRHLLATNTDLAKRLDDLESRYDKQFRVVFDAIRQLMSEPEPKHKPMGFTLT